MHVFRKANTMEKRYIPLINKAMYFVVVGLAFLLPTFFAPFTVEYFEFNKLALAAVVTLVLLALWAIKMLSEGKVEMTKSPLNVPILLLVVAYGVSTWFSVAKFVSVFGSYGRWNTSLVVMAISALLYFVITANIKSKDQIKDVMKFFVFGTSVSSVVAIISYLGVKILPFAFAQVRNFTLTGSSVTAAAIAAIAIVFALSLIIDEEKNQKLKTVLSVLVGLNFLAVALIGAVQAWALLLAAVVAFAALTPADKLKAAASHLTVLAGVLVVIGVVFSVPALKDTLRLNHSDYPQELKLDLGPSWVVTTGALRESPIFGRGPSTFYLSYSNFRPLSQNSQDNWTLRYDKAANEYLDILSTLGVVGLLVFGFLAYKTVIFAKNTDGSAVNAALSAVAIGMLVYFAFSYSTVLLMIAFFLVLALLTSYSEGNYAHSLTQGMVETAVISFSISGRATNVTTRTVSVVFAIPMLLLVGVGGYYTFRTYAAEVMMRRSIAAAQNNKAVDLFQSQRQAIILNPYIDAYHSSFAQTNYLLANAIAQSKKPEEINDEERKNIQSLIAASIQETRITTEILNPLNPGNWEQRGRLYSLLQGVAQDADNWSVGAYTRAIQFDPTNPVLRVNLGGVFYAKKDYANAERYFRGATQLKPDYANGYYNLAQSLKQQKKYQDAITAMNIVARLVDAGSDDAKKANDELTALKAMPEVAGAADQKPTVNDLGKTGQPQQRPAGQQGLTQPGVTQQPTIRESTQSLAPVTQQR